jgi:[ribosomal protein S18]-alanine N-acetyltransferase
MAVFQAIRNLFAAPHPAKAVVVMPAPETCYAIRPMTDRNIDEVMDLNLRCFSNGENYTRSTFAYILSEPGALCYQAVTDSGSMAAFVCVLVSREGTAHLTTIGVAPEHRRRGLAERLLVQIENALKCRGVSTVALEVRVGNSAAQRLYSRAGYTRVQRLPSYYNNGEDGYLMTKSLV